MRCVVLVLAVNCAFNLFAQDGDKEGEAQTPRVPKESIPPAPALTPDQALKTFKLQSGFRIELVAGEPLVRDPIQIAFDPDGRIWVVEMRGFMPNIDGAGETNKVGAVAVLEDTDGDGKMDKRTVFLDGLVMPRALALVRGGALVAEPPNLWFCRDTNGDLKCDEKNLVAGDYATQGDPALGVRANPEHASNGLLWALDNWIYSANHTARFRNTDGTWQRQPTIFRGQWGISQDDFGRLFYNSNEDPLRADFVPSSYLDRNPHYRHASGANAQLYDDKVVWPIRVNPGVNRGYREGQLRPNGTLATFTAACAPLVYRGDNFPEGFYGSVFVCEPAGNLIRRYVLETRGVSFKAKNAYDKAEFLSSTDERFRPVNLNNGPDGSLYIVDMYHGILEHRIYMTGYLRQQILDRSLDQRTDLGRIYRVVSESKPPGPQPRLSKASPEELMKCLSHPNGWWRDTAQRLLVERNDPSAVASLKALAASGANPLGRLHALWTLEGVRQVDLATLKKAMGDDAAKIRAAAIRISEPLLRNQPELLNELLKHVDDLEPDVQLQLAFTLGEVNEPRADEAMARIALANAADDYIRDAVISGLGGRELEFLESLLSLWRVHRDHEPTPNPSQEGTKQGAAAPLPGGVGGGLAGSRLTERLPGEQSSIQQAAGREKLLSALAESVFNEAKPDRVDRLLALAANASAGAGWQRVALLDGILNTVPTEARAKSKPVRLNAEPASLAALASCETKEVQERAKKIGDLVTWPGKPGATREVPAKPLTAEEEKRFGQGKELFLISCGACHQAHGLGQEGLAPPLVDSDWVLGPPARLVRIVLHGLHGPVTVKGKLFQLDMPALGIFDDEQIAALLTYVRHEWGHTASPIEPDLVKKIRAETEKREEAWTEAELMKIP
jgi:putative membrane-bound dehydrogenase-like protein